MSARAAATAAVQHEPIYQIPIAQIVSSPTNPRKHFNQKEIDDLAESVKRVGVIEPVLTRPPTEDADLEEVLASSAVDLIFGEKRKRAALKAGLATLPCMVRWIPDDQVLELQLAENVQRGDMHPLDEADGYAALQRDHKKTIAEIAERMGKPASYIQQRLQLAKLGKVAREAFFEGKLTISVAFQIARLADPKMQDEATRALTRLDPGETETDFSPASAADARRIIRHDFLLKLADAPFKLDDDGLVPAAGACTTCPKRTGNQRELFDDVLHDKRDPGAADLCTDASCWKKKVDVVWKRQKEDAQKQGIKVLDEKATKTLFFEHDSRIRYGAAYVDPEEDTVYVNHRSVKLSDLAGTEAGKAIKPVLARDPDGKPRTLWPRAAAEKVAAAAKEERKKAAKSGKPEKRTPQQESELRERKKKIFENKVRKLAAKLAMTKLVTDVEKAEPTAGWWAFLFAHLSHISGNHNNLNEQAYAIIAERRGLFDKAGTPATHLLEKLIDTATTLTEPQARALFFELRFAQFYHGDLWGSWEQLGTVLKDRGLDRKKFEAAAREELRRLDAEKGAAKLAAAQAKKRLGRGLDDLRQEPGKVHTTLIRGGKPKGKKA